jgi:hypothetical protein
MAELLVPPIVIAALVLAPVFWRAWTDRRRTRALVVRAAVHRAVVRALGGESYVAVDVEPPAPWQAGRVVLSVPAGWASLVDEVAAAALAETPARWELVVKAAPAPADAAVAA